jgi:hypothetical protein
MDWYIFFIVLEVIKKQAEQLCIDELVMLELSLELDEIEAELDSVGYELDVMGL